VMGDYDHTIAFSQRALAIAEALGDVGVQVTATYILGHVYHLQGDYFQAIELLGRNVAYLEGELLHTYFGSSVPFAVSSRTSLVNCLAELGEFAEGIARSEEGVRITEAVAHPASFIFAYTGVGRLYLHKGDVQKAIPALERALAFCQGAHLPYFFPRLASALGMAYALSGRITEALALLEQAVQQTTATQRQDGRSLWVANQSETMLLAGRPEEALLLAQQALELAQTHQERGHEAWVLRLLGDIAAQREPLEVEEAAAHYRQALALAEELGMRPLQAHCHRGLGILYAHIGRREQARAALTAAIDLYRSMDMTFWLPQAEAALARTSGSGAAGEG
jgi:tetratricopeptide (TPR) repeat protein